MKLIAIISLLVFSFSQAQAKDAYVQGLLGFQSGALTIGVDYEARSAGNAVGFGGYFMFADEEEGVTAQALSFGALSKIHVFENNKVDVSVGPGFGISMVEVGDEDETIIGPVLKFGLLYKFSDKTAFGLEMFKAYNWLSDEFTGSVDTFNAALRVKL